MINPPISYIATDLAQKKKSNSSLRYFNAHEAYFELIQKLQLTPGKEYCLVVLDDPHYKGSIRDWIYNNTKTKYYIMPRIVTEKEYQAALKYQPKTNKIVTSFATLKRRFSFDSPQEIVFGNKKTGTSPIHAISLEQNYLRFIFEWLQKNCKFLIKTANFTPKLMATKKTISTSQSISTQLHRHFIIWKREFKHVITIFFRK